MYLSGQVKEMADEDSDISTEEKKWIKDLKKQDKKLNQGQKFSKKDLELAQQFMVQAPAKKEEAVNPEQEKIFNPGGKEEVFDIESKLSNAKTIEYPYEEEGDPVFAPDPKKEKIVHLSDEKNAVESIDIDKHESKGQVLVEINLAKKKKKKTKTE
jgi:hypothetical protein